MYKETRGLVSLHQPELEEVAEVCRQNLADFHITDDEVRVDDISEETIEVLGKFLTLNEQEEALECSALVFYKH